MVDRPGRMEGKIAVLDLMPFNDAQVANWLERWKGIVAESQLDLPRPDPQELADSGGLEELVRTPILLLMVAATWGRASDSVPDRQSCPELSVLPPLPPAVPQSRGRKRKWGRQPYCHTNAFAKSRAGNVTQLFVCSPPFL